MIPDFCSMAIHALVLTSSDVQNGKSTNIISKFDVRSGSVDSK